MEIDKNYFTLPEILSRWEMAENDFIYLAENDELRLSIRVFGHPVEFGDIEETQDGQTFSAPWEQSYFTGLLDLRVNEVFEIFRQGKADVGLFRTPKADYACFWGPKNYVTIRKSDVVVRRDERDRFESKVGFVVQEALSQAGAFHASPDYYRIECNGHRFRLGEMQAQVVRQLHEAAQRGEAWQSGKALLGAANSTSAKLSDLFKSQKNWRILIESDERGRYRLLGV